MLDLSDVLETAPNALVSGLPASASVDLVLTQHPDVGETELPHTGSPDCFDAWENFDIALEETLHTCVNPGTLLAALDRYTDHRIRASILTNPATPRTPEVMDETKRFAADAASDLATGFARHYTNHGQTSYSPTAHADLRDALLCLNEDELHDDILKMLGISLSLTDCRIPYDTFFPEANAARLDEKVTNLLREHYEIIIDRKADGTLVLNPLPGVETQLFRLVGRHPETLTEEEADTVREELLSLSNRHPEIRPDSLLGRLGHNCLHLADFTDNAWLAHAHLSNMAGEPTAAPARWLSEWIEQGLMDDLMSVSEVPWGLARAVGQEAWAVFGDNPSAWALFLSFIQEGWDGTLQELLETVQSASV